MEIPRVDSVGGSAAGQHSAGILHPEVRAFEDDAAAGDCQCMAGQVNVAGFDQRIDGQVASQGAGALKVTC